MEINIIIECDNEEDLLLHLSVIRLQIKKAMKKTPTLPDMVLEDNNCYGYHKVEIGDTRLTNQLESLVNIEA
jgi:hypothetical protein